MLVLDKIKTVNIKKPIAEIAKSVFSLERKGLCGSLACVLNIIIFINSLSAFNAPCQNFSCFSRYLSYVLAWYTITIHTTN